MLEASRRKGPFNAWAVKVLRGQTRASRHLYHVRDVDSGYGLEMVSRSKKQALKVKSNMPRSLQMKILRN